MHHSRGTWQSSSLVGDRDFEHPVDARFVEPEAVTELDPTPQQLSTDSEESSEGWPDSCPDDQRLTHMCGPGPLHLQDNVENVYKFGSLLPEVKLYTLGA